MAPSFSRAQNKTLIGEPQDAWVDVGIAVYEGHDVKVNVFSGTSVLDAGERTSTTESIGQLLSPLSREEVGTIRCIGLNYVSHANEMGLPLPTTPTVFLKPSTSLASPWPQPSILPRITQHSDTGDYESEMAIIIGKSAKNVSEENAMDYVLGFTAANDISSRASQNSQSQWCFSKGFDGSCPLGPVLVSTSLVADASQLRIRGIKNSKTVQDCSLEDMIFNVAQLVSFLSQGTTLPAGTVILTGTPPGVGAAQRPENYLRAGDEFWVELLPHVGTLITRFENED